MNIDLKFRRNLEKELILSSKISENTENNEIIINAKRYDFKYANSNEEFWKTKRFILFLSTELLNTNIEKLNSHVHNLSSDNLKAIYLNIVKSIETMKMTWKKSSGSLKELDDYDDKVTNKL